MSDNIQDTKFAHVEFRGNLLIDVPLLVAQRDTLLYLCENYEFEANDAENLQNVAHLLDHLLDTAREFGK